VTRHNLLRRLPLKNLSSRPLRTFALIFIVSVLSGTFFGGTVLSFNLKTGLASMQERMGADLMVVPQVSRPQAEALLTNTGSSTFYFINNIAELVAKANGIEKLTAQTYIASLTASCCDDQVQIIGFNPQTDFIIEPWVSSQYDKQLADGDVIAGSKIKVSASGDIKLFGHHFPVAAQLAPTGTSLDSSVFVNPATVPQVVKYSAEVGHPAIPEEHAGNAISAVLLTVKDGVDPHEVADNITKATGMGSLGFVYPGGITATTKAHLNVITGYAYAFVGAVWVLGAIVLFAVFLTSVNERKKEFASLRIMGMRKSHLVRVYLTESALIGLAGGVIGIGLASLVVFPYSTLITDALALPYLQISIAQVLGLAVGSVLAATLVGMAASSLSAWKLSRAETYTTFQRGQ